MSPLKYFAYGSNMSPRRLLSRVPSAKVIGTAVLLGHRLEFHKVSSKDGSGKCDVVPSKSDKVFGVLCELKPEEKKTLDELEGLNNGYDEKRVDVELESGVIVSAITYYATNTNPQLRPYTWYTRHV
jgi:cation transport regulator ChaC